MKKLFMFVALFTLAAILIGCANTETALDEITTDTEEQTGSGEQEDQPPYTVTVKRSEIEIALHEGGEKIALTQDSVIGNVYEPEVAVSGISVYCEVEGEGSIKLCLYSYHTSPERTYEYGATYEVSATVTESGYVDLMFPTTVNRKCIFTLSSPTENVFVYASPNESEEYSFVDGDIADGERAVASKLIAEEKTYEGKYDMVYLLQEQQVTTPTQMMGYIVRTQNSKIIVIDGGNSQDSTHLMSMLQEITGKSKPTVDLWILTHGHEDHFGALYQILKTRAKRIDIKAIYHDFIDYDVCLQYDGAGARAMKKFTDILDDKFSDIVHTLKLGETLTLDTVSIDVMYVPETVYSVNTVNNSSVLLKMHIGGQSILFTGDMGVEAGNEVLEMYPNGELESDFCQMAHHGQSGTTREFYEAVKMKACLWNTPLWLWNNDRGNSTGFNTGDWQTIIVRDWMDELGVDIHYISHLGTSAIPFPYPFED